MVVSKRHHASFFPPNRQGRYDLLFVAQYLINSLIELGTKLEIAALVSASPRDWKTPQFPDYYL
jgi:hypothetical protein